jgi:hypothetical protein
MGLDPSDRGRWTMRRKAALSTFDVRLEGRLSLGRIWSRSTYTLNLTGPQTARGRLPAPWRPWHPSARQVIATRMPSMISVVASVSEARDSFADVVDRADRDDIPTIITRRWPRSRRRHPHGGAT